MAAQKKKPGTGTDVTSSLQQKFTWLIRIPRDCDGNERYFLNFVLVKCSIRTKSGIYP